MLAVVANSWALLLGVMLLMVGNGMQGTLLGIRGGIEGFSAQEMSFVMSAYFAGFLGGSRLTPLMIARVGHVRVFAALGSLISAAFILYAAAPHPWAWMAMRLLVGFCFSGVYVVAESWLNDSSSNETRGQTLSVYLIVQMVGVIAAQGVLNLADPAGFQLFVVISVLVSVSFAPILLSVSPAPVFRTAKPMSLFSLFRASPLGVVGTFFLGGVFSAIFGMASVYGAQVGLSIAEISIFVAMIYTGGLVMQYPIGRLSDRMDRRRLILFVCIAGAVGAAIAIAVGPTVWALYAAAFVIGGVANPLYTLLIAYTNDFLEHDQMAAASGGLMFLNGVGATIGPLLIGYTMDAFGAWTFFGYLTTTFTAISAYALYRMTRRRSSWTPSEEQTPWTPVAPQASPVAMAVAQDHIAEQLSGDGSEQEAAEYAEAR